MAAEMRGRSGAGWVILALVLAVPGFLFFSWRSRLKNAAPKARSARPPAGGVFQAPPPASGRLVNPISSAPRASSVALTPRAAVPRPPAGPAQAPATATALPLPRDPMLSPAEAEKIRAAALVSKEPRSASRRRAPKRPPVEKFIVLQGVIAIPGGQSLALINGATLRAGETFTVKNYPGKVKTVRVSPSGITLEYQKRRFTLSVRTR